MLLDVTGEEFETLMDVLSRLNYITTEEGSQQVAALISDQAELNTDFQVPPSPSLSLSLSLSCDCNFELSCDCHVTLG